MTFLYPLILILLIPAIILCFWFTRIHYKALKELTSLVHGSKISNLSVLLSLKENKELSFKKFWIYFVFLSISFLSIVISLAGPVLPGDSQIQSRQTSVYLVFDGSWSMDAEDVKHLPEYSYVPRFRFEEARFHAMELNKQMEEVSFGVITFAAEAVQHSHPLADKEWIHNILFNQMNSHNTFFSGTNYGAAFTELIQSSKYLGEGFQVVLYSDGDASAEEKVKALEMAKMFHRLSIPIHVVALGTREGRETSLTFNLLSVVDTENSVTGDAAGKEYRASTNVVAQNRKSVPDFDFLGQLAVETEGEMIITTDGESGIEKLKTAIEKGRNRDQVLLWEAGGKKSLSLYFFILPFLFFLYDFLWIRRAVKFGK
jgi:hypothetical protein